MNVTTHLSVRLSSGTGLYRTTMYRSNESFDVTLLPLPLLDFTFRARGSTLNPLFFPRSRSPSRTSYGTTVHFDW